MSKRTIKSNKDNVKEMDTRIYSGYILTPIITDDTKKELTDKIIKIVKARKDLCLEFDYFQMSDYIINQLYTKGYISYCPQNGCYGVGPKSSEYDDIKTIRTEIINEVDKRLINEKKSKQNELSR